MTKAPMSRNTPALPGAMGLTGDAKERASARRRPTAPQLIGEALELPDVAPDDVERAGRAEMFVGSLDADPQTLVALFQAMGGIVLAVVRPLGLIDDDIRKHRLRLSH